MNPSTMSAKPLEARTISVQSIHGNPYQPRLGFVEEDVQELAMSIAKVGLLHPPLAHEREDGKYELIAGERRVRACQWLGWHEIPMWVIPKLTPQVGAQAALVENIQRVDLNPMEIAKALDRLCKDFSYTHHQLADILGKKRSTITNYLRLLKLHPDVRKALVEQEISMGHAKLLMTLDHELQRKVLKAILSKGWSVHFLQKKLLGSLKKNSLISNKGNEGDLFIRDIQEKLVQALSLKVQIDRRAKGGTVLIKYSEPHDLTRLMELMGLDEKLSQEPS